MFPTFSNEEENRCSYLNIYFILMSDDGQAQNTRNPKTPSSHGKSR